jgi:plasmid maintenance system antidote protein VapI
MPRSFKTGQPRSLPIPPDPEPVMTLADILKREFSKRNIDTIRDAARFLGTNYETVRLLLNNVRAPKDAVLARFAKKLGIDPTVLLLTAHRERLPREMQAYFLMPVAPAPGGWERRRRWPLSQEQCDYLGRILTSREIQLIRMCRQMTPEKMQDAFGYLTYLFERSRSGQAAIEQEQAQPTGT